MKYQTFKPSAQLSNYIHCFWALESAAPLAKPEKERIFPDGCVELIFHFGDLFRDYENGDTGRLQVRSFLHGQIKKYINLQRTGIVGVFSARFKPAGLQPFVDFEVKKITCKTLAVEDAWPNGGKQLKDTVLNAVTHGARVAAIEKFLLDRLNKDATGTALVEHCVAQITKHQGNLSLDALADELQVSKRHLERTFNAAVGLSPKLFCRITRFNWALQLIERKDFASFTSVAHEGGFYDQAHFIKDFKALTGLNPKKYFSENLEMVRFFNL